MGFRSKWLAVPHIGRTAALEATGLVLKGTQSKFLETGWYGLTLREHFIVVGSGWDHQGRITEAQALRLSNLGETFFWSADDTTMCSYMSAQLEGVARWSFTHDDEHAARIIGSAPEAVLTAVREQQAKHREGVDYVYEAAHVAGERLTGFRHDWVDAPEGVQFEVLRAVEAPPPEVQRKGPFAVHLEREANATLVEVEALEALADVAFHLLHYRRGELAGVDTHASRPLVVGQRVSLTCPLEHWALRVIVSGTKTYEFGPASRTGFFAKLFGW